MDIQYDIGQLKIAMDKCEVNIKTFEDAIQKERDTKIEYKNMIRVLEQKIAVNNG